MPVERKLAAILSADVVGYSRLMAEDEDETVRRIGAYRREVTGLVEEHRGRVVDFTGDNLLAEFPTATDAVEAATEVQRVIKARNAALPAGRAMEFRIGVHLGEVRVEGVRLFGDGVNIAARLEGLAEAGGVCISGNVRDLVHSKLDLDLDDLGEQPVKNIPDPVRVYRLKVRVGELADESRRTGARSSVVYTGAALGAVALAVLVYFLLDERLTTPSGAPITTIAVLPFDDMSASGDQRWLGDGMAEELIEMLSRIKELSVIARTSSFSLRGQDVETVGDRLGAGSVVEGSVRRVGDQLRITAQLIRVADGSHVWAARYDRGADDLLNAQSAIAREIAEGVRSELGIAFELPRSDAVQRYLPRDVRAYQLWKRALVLMSTLTEEATLEAREYLLQALEIDPEFAQAHAQFGWNHQNLWTLAYDRREERRSDARAAALRALQLDPSNATAHELLGYQALLRNEFEEAERILTAALEDHPSHPGLLAQYAWLLFEAGRLEEALRNAQRSAELDPLWAVRTRFWGFMLAGAGKYEAAIEKVERALEMNPQEPLALRELALFLHLNGDDAAALEALVRRDPASETLLRDGFERGGYEAMLRAVIAEWSRAGTPCGPRNDLDDFFFGAEVYALVGEADPMFLCLDEWFHVSGRISHFSAWPAFAPYRDDPRFTALLRRMNLAE